MKNLIKKTKEVIDSAVSGKYYRKLYPYTCKECGEQRYTLLVERRLKQKCTLCERKVKVPEDQQSLFEIENG